MKTQSLPENWKEVKYEFGEGGLQAFWKHTDLSVVIDVAPNVEGGHGGYTAVVHQHVEDGEYETTIDTHAHMADDVPSLEDKVVDFMEEVNNGEHIYRAIGHELWREFVQFYCISTDQVDADALPGTLSASELIDAIDNEQYDNEITELPDDLDDMDSMLTIDVFPRHKTEMEENNE